MIDKTISHYKILERIGEGGMGIVYKAEDTKLKRLVALKFLPPTFVADPTTKERFIQEAQAASSLQHNNICTIHEIDQTTPAPGELGEGQMYIVMDYYDGETLKLKIENGKLVIEEAIDYALQIAQGLKEAHLREVIHRDIKPANIIITNKNEAKILDFGLSKFKGQTKITRTGSTLGTVAYMSPEQARGEEVDHRSDIWSLGVLFYEMISGQLPFKGEYEQTVIYSILNENPAPLTGLGSSESKELEQILQKCLEKDRSERYQHIDELVADLTRLKEHIKGPIKGTMEREKSKLSLKKIVPLGFVAVAILTVVVYLIYYYLIALKEKDAIQDRKMLVVLPFENLGPPEDEYFADGITEEITSRLAEISELGIIARTSALQYKNTNKTIDQIGEELGVDYLLEGTVRWEKQSDAESRVRVTPQLIRISDGTHIWTDRYDAVLAGIFKIQSDIAEQIAQALQITLIEPERRALRAVPTENLEAYDYYLRGNFYLSRSQIERDSRLALSMFEHAVHLDPKFALAYAKLSIIHSDVYWFHWDRSEERLVKAREAVDKAFKLNPNLSEAHMALGYLYYHGYLDYKNALEHFDIARKSQPNNAEIIAGIGYVQRRQGKFKQAVTSLIHAMEFDPRSVLITYNIGETYVLIRNYIAAESFLDQTIRLNPEYSHPYALKARVYLSWKGDLERARAVLDMYSQISGSTDDPDITYVQIMLHIFGLDYQSALDRLEESSLESFSNQFFFATKTQLKAQLYGLMNQSDQEQIHYELAKKTLENLVRKDPDDTRYHSALGIAYAGLGLKEKALQEGNIAVNLLPVIKEAYRGTYRVIDLAHIYVIVGEHEKAIDQIEFLLSRPAMLSVNLLRLDPIWNPLKNSPRFQKF